MRLDHLAISATDLERATADLEKRLGTAFAPGGKHPAMGTHNRLLSLGPDLYLEVIAIDPDARPPDRPRWFGLDAFDGQPRLTNWIVACDDLERALLDAPAGSGKPMDLSRGDLRWRITVPENGLLPCDGLFPALIQWQGEGHPTKVLPDTGCRLVALTVSHPEISTIDRALAKLSDPRLTLKAGPASLSAVLETPKGRVSLR